SRRVMPGAPDVCGACPCTAPPRLAIAYGTCIDAYGAARSMCLEAGQYRFLRHRAVYASVLGLGYGPPRGAPMQQPCPHDDQPAMSLLRLVLRGEILRAHAPTPLLCAELLQPSGFLRLADAPQAPPVRSPPGTRPVLRR